MVSEKQKKYEAKSSLKKKALLLAVGPAGDAARAKYAKKTAKSNAKNS